MNALLRYTLLQIPGWLLVAVLLWWAHGRGWIGIPLAAVILAAWIGKDVVLYPLCKKAFEKGPAIGPQALVGRHADTVTALAPTGQIRLDGELWTARPSDGEPIPAGRRIIVLDNDGLILLVEAAD